MDTPRNVAPLQFPPVLRVIVTEEEVDASIQSGGRSKRTRCPISRAVRSALTAASLLGTYEVEVYAGYGPTIEERKVRIVIRPEGTDKNDVGESDHKGLAIYTLPSRFREVIRDFDQKEKMAPFAATAQLAA